MRTFQADEGWSWQLEIWRGDIDLDGPPTANVDGRKPYKSQRVAFRSGLAAAAKVT